MQFNSQGEIIPAINNEDVKGFRVMRSAVNKTKFNVYAVDDMGVPLVPFATELEHEAALQLAQTLNTPYTEAEIIRHETAEVEMADGTIRYFQVQV